MWCITHVCSVTHARCHTWEAWCSPRLCDAHPQGVSRCVPDASQRCHNCPAQLRGVPQACPAHPQGARLPHSEARPLQDAHGGEVCPVAGAGVSPGTVVRHGRPVTGSGDARGRGGLPAAGAPRCRAVPVAGLSRDALPGRPAVASRGCQLAGASWPRAVTFARPQAGGAALPGRPDVRADDGDPAGAFRWLRKGHPAPRPLLGAASHPVPPPAFPVAPRRGSPLGARPAPALAVPKNIPGVCPGGNAAAVLLQTI